MQKITLTTKSHVSACVSEHTLHVELMSPTCDNDLLDIFNAIRDFAREHSCEGKSLCIFAGMKEKESDLSIVKYNLNEEKVIFKGGKAVYEHSDVYRPST